MNETVKIKRINNFEYSFALSTKKGIKFVSKALTFKNPDFFAYSQKIEKFNKRNFSFKIGMLPTLISFLKDKKITYELLDYDFSLPKTIDIDDRMSGRFIHQKKAVEAFFRKRFGIIVVPTRGGKTFIASEILRIFLETDRGNFLYIVDNITLFKQVISDIKKYFKRYRDIEIGEICSGKIDISKRITVGMIQTIQSILSDRCKNKNKQKELQKYLKNLAFLCVDEIHDNCSNSKLKIYKRCKELQYQLCLSATPYRENTFVQNLKLKEWSGDIIYTITEKKLRERGVLSNYRVYIFEIDHNNIDYQESIDDSDYIDCKRKLIFENEFRDQILKRIIEVLKQMNLKTLVLFQSLEHGYRMQKFLGEKFICGDTKDRERENAKRIFLEDKEGGVLLASNIFKKGITLPEVEVLINADEGLEDANTIQKKGRVLGITSTKKKSLILDFFDIYDAYLTDHSVTRLKTYINSIGEENVKILDTNVKEYLDTFKKWTKNWFELKYE